MPAFRAVISRLGDRGLNGSLGQRYFTQGASALLGLGMLLSSTAANADVVPDGSTNSALSNSPITCLGSSPCISGGDRQGDNLFHSFREFTIDAGETVYLGRFASPLDLLRIGPDLANIDKIFIRVVGSPTDIQGTLEAVNLLASPYDVIFLSPQGITIGDGAELRYPGNFLFSTAERLDFGGGAIFDATNSAPLLTLSNFGNLPETLGLGNSPGIINFSNNSPAVRETIEIPQTQHQLAIIGGSINFDGVEIATPGKLNVASVGNEQTVGLTFQSDGIDFDYRTASTFQDIQLTNSSLSSRSFSNPGDANSLELRGENLRLRQNSLLSTFTNAAGGDINIDFTGLVELETASEIASRAITASAIAGDISINSNEVRLAQGSPIVSFTTTDGGDINLDVAGSVILDSQSKVFTQTTIPTGSAGNITLAAASLDLLAQNQISTSTNANGGEVSLVVTGDIQVDNSSLIITSAQNSAAIAGDITVIADSLQINNAGKVISGSNAFTSGSINIDLTGDLNIVGQGEIATFVTTPTTPTAGSSTGDIEITGTNLSIQSAGKIYSLTEDSGGDITLRFADDVSLNLDSSISVRASGSGNAGRLDLTARNLNLNDQSNVVSQTRQGGGDLNLTLGENIAVRAGSSIASTVEENSSGSAGELSLTGRNLTVDGNNSIIFSLTGNGAANITLDLTDDVTLSNGAQLGTFLTNNGDAMNSDAGSISLQASNLILNDNADIITETSGGQGNIDIDLTGDLSVLGGSSGDSEIIAKLSTTEGAAGTISISASNVSFDQGLLLTETDQPGGDIDVDATHTIQFDQSLIRLSSPTGTGHTGNLSLISQSNIAPVGISLIGTEIFNEATNTGGDVTLTAQGEVELRGGSFISIDSSGVDGNLTVAASAFRSNDIAGDNDVLLNQGTLSNLSLPADVTGFDPSASQVLRSNGNSELLPNSFPGPQPPTVVLPPSTPPPVTPPPVTPPPVTPPPVTPPPVESPVPSNPSAEPETDGNSPPSQDGNPLGLERLWQFYGDVSFSAESIPWSCVATGEGQLRISGRGGIGSSPSSLNGSSTLADLGRFADLGSFDEEITASTLASHSPNGTSALMPATLRPNWLEAKAWQRDEQGQIKLVAQADSHLAQPRPQRCQSLH